MYLLQKIDNVLEGGRYGNYTWWASHTAHKSQKNISKPTNNYTYLGEEKVLQNQFWKHHVGMFCLSCRTEYTLPYFFSLLSMYCFILCSEKELYYWSNHNNTFWVFHWLNSGEKRNPGINWELKSHFWMKTGSSWLGRFWVTVTRPAV